MGQNVNKNESHINELQKTIEKIESKMESQGSRVDMKLERLESLVLSARAGRPHSVSGCRDTGDIRKEPDTAYQRNYAISRRSMRIWPVKGDTDEQIMDAGYDFMITKLRVDPEDCPRGSIERIRRSKPPRRSNITWEVIVVFKEKETRDTIMTHGKNLAPYKNAQGMPTAGIRFDYPSHLGNEFRALEWYGREMRLQ